MSVLLLAFIGGIISAVSTSLGSFMTPLFTRINKLQKYHMSMDFALGVMLSAVAFSLVGPELMKGHHLNIVLMGLIIGSVFIATTHHIIDKFKHKRFLSANKILLISALIFHNFPEGMGAGASLGGMNLSDAIPVQIALSIQNIAEGLLLSLLLLGVGLRLSYAILGGIASGLVEMSGAVTAGFFMQQIQGLLPFFLSLAGGAMMTSVILEISENISMGKKIHTVRFISGLAVIPFTNLLLGQ